jgi:hypothetical protein
MFRNHKELVDFWKVRNLFKELSSLDNDVDCSLCQIANSHFNIKHSKPFDKVFHDLGKTVGSRFAQNHDHSDFNFFSSPSSNNLDAENPHTLITLH